MEEKQTQADKTTAKSNGTPIADIGRKALYQRITERFTCRNESSLPGLYAPGTASASLFSEAVTVSAQNLMLEGVDFDLSYFPLKFLGYKAVVGALAKVGAMNALARRILISIGLSQRFFVEDVDNLFLGVEAACLHYSLDLGGVDIKSSYTGLSLCVTAVGECEQGCLCSPEGAKENQLICLSGGVGAAYMGLQLLEREKKVFIGESNKDQMPELKGYEYIIEHYLKPEFPLALIDNLRKDDYIPTAMCLTNQGLATAVLQIAHSSKCGAKIFLEKIPIARECFAFAKEMADDNVDPILAALGGGEEYEVLFTLPLSYYENLSKEYSIDIIGHITEQEQACILVTPDGNTLDMDKMGF